MHETIFSKKMIAGGRTYYFDIKETKMGDKFLQITETRMQDGTMMRNNITVFGNHLEEFCECLKELPGKCV